MKELDISVNNVMVQAYAIITNVGVYVWNVKVGAYAFIKK
jgi:hypothetical protein